MILFAFVAATLGSIVVLGLVGEDAFSAERTNEQNEPADEGTTAAGKASLGPLLSESSER